ncbi:MAG: helix-turn-helix transcriptional regulator [Candidatus Coproplasma sp.]
MTTGEKIAEGRKKLKLTQQQFADTLGVSRQAVSRWESDLAFPETETLIKMSDMFGCSVDYLLKYNSEGESQKSDGKGEKGSGVIDLNGIIKNLRFEYKSKTTVFGVPLVHINIGLFAVAKGIIAIGPVAIGVVSIGAIAIGLIAFACLALGAVALGAIAGGLLSFGGVAVGVIAFGGLAIGVMSYGGCAIGLFAIGGYADGRYIAVGDYAVGQIAFGQTTAIGAKTSVTPQTYEQLKEEAFSLMDGFSPFWKGFINLCKRSAEVLMRQ